MRRHFVARIDVRIDTNTVTAWRVVVVYRARAWHEVLRIFSIDTALKGVAAQHDIFLFNREWQARGDTQLLFNDINTGNLFSHRVLYLHTSIHLYKVETAIFVEEFERSGTAVTDFNTGIDTGL